MAVDHSILAEISGVTTAGTTLSIYANPAGTTTTVRQIWLHAPSDGMIGFTSSLVKLFNVPDSATSLGNPSVTNQFFQRSIATNETYILDCGVPGIILADQNDTIRIWHTNSTDGAAGTTITYQIMGTVET